MIIYVDVLFVVNFFITFLLLLLTSRLARLSQSVPRLLFASALGGLYSLVILVDKLNLLIGFVGKILVAFLIVFVAFGFKRLGAFLKAGAIFFFSNMLFLGVITAVCLLFKPNGIALNNSTVYFDISAKTLLLSALFAYLISTAVIKLYNRTVSKKEIYSLTIIKGEQSFHLYAFVDTGNKLKEPFSSYPVIIADKSKINVKADRIIPCNTVSGEGMLSAFKPDKIILSSGSRTYETDRAYVALSDIDSADFSAILNPEILNL